MTPWIIIITITISGVTSLYAPIHYNVLPTVGCVCTDRVSNSISYTFIHGFTTPFVMLVFVLLTYRNVKQSRSRSVNIKQHFFKFYLHEYILPYST